MKLQAGISIPPPVENALCKALIHPQFHQIRRLFWN